MIYQFLKTNSAINKIHILLYRKILKTFNQNDFAIFTPLNKNLFNHAKFKNLFNLRYFKSFIKNNLLNFAIFIAISL